MESTIHYQANICGGDFKHVRDCFDRWKQEPLVFRRNLHMFEGKKEVRRVTEHVFANGEIAHSVLAEMCDPHAPYALAAEIRDDGRDLWLVMAAYEED
jgi:hypothetical protein